VDEVLSADPALAPLVARRPGIRIPGSVDGSETLLRALIDEPVPGEQLPQPDGELTTLFPTAAVFAEHTTGTARAVSTAIAEGRLDVHVGADPEELAATLDSYGVKPAVGRYVRMRVLGSPDILLSTVDGSEAWRPWRSYASVHLGHHFKR
jgi:AraC family transcriptional regulator of adaptative response / DNA-3-methyladenine glycosylase II